MLQVDAIQPPSGDTASDALYKIESFIVGPGKVNEIQTLLQFGLEGY